MASNRIVHFEIPARNPQALSKFYGGMFGWNFQKAPIPNMEYLLAQTGSGEGIDGAIMTRMNDGQPWMNYVDVESIDASLEQAVKLGGKVALAKMGVMDMGFVAAVIDPEGNICGLWERKG